MTVRLPVLVFVVAAQIALAQTPPAAPPLPSSTPPFDAWLGELRHEAAERGISPALIERALTGIEPVEKILERDRTQTEFALDLDAYLKRRITRDTVRMARRMSTRHRTLLNRVSAKYGVPPGTLVAVWGLESDFGRFMGVRPTVPTLVTLAYDSRRGPLFRNELFNALQIVDRGDETLDQMRGSWAGALGQPQFMPSSYLLYAQDFDGDGRRDIWKSQPDVFASIAYFLQQHGWTKGETWGREVKLAAAARETLDALPRRAEGCRAQRVMTEAKPLKDWRSLGVRTAAGGPVAAIAKPASFVQVGSRAFLVYGNYDALLGYNCSHNYAMSVAFLADRLR